MKVPVKIWYPLFRRIRKFKFDRNFFVFLFFLGISAIFWFFTQLGKDTQAVISYPVRYTFTFPDRILINDPPSRLKFNMKGNGYTLLKYILQPKINPIELNVQSYPLRPIQGEPDGSYYLLTSYIRGAVSDQLSRDLSLIGISPDTLVFVFDRIVNRKLPVVPDLKINLTRQVMLKSPFTIKPDSVQVSGPARIMDTLNNVKTAYIQLDQVGESVQKEVLLTYADELTVKPKKVNLEINVEQFTEATVEVPIMVVNVPDSLALKTFPSRVKVLFHVVLSRYNQMGPQLFDAVVDYSTITGDSRKIQVQLRRMPENIESVRVSPPSVDYLIEKKQ